MFPVGWIWVGPALNWQVLHRISCRQVRICLTYYYLICLMHLIYLIYVMSHLSDLWSI